MGYSVRRNDPYAGGYITRHYGRPREGVHALQIELSRALYMDEASLTRGEGFARTCAHATTLLAAWRRRRGLLATEPGAGAAAVQKKWRHREVPPSLGRKRPRSRRRKRLAAMHKLGG